MSKEWDASAYFQEVGLENVSSKYISITDLKLLLYSYYQPRPGD